MGLLPHADLMVVIGVEGGGEGNQKVHLDTEVQRENTQEKMGEGRGGKDRKDTHASLVMI